MLKLFLLVIPSCKLPRKWDPSSMEVLWNVLSFWFNWNLFFGIIRAWHWSNQKVSILLWSPRQIGWGFVLLFSTSLHNEMLCFHEQALIQTARLCDRTPHPSLCLQAGLNLTHPRLMDVSSRLCFKISSIFSITWLNTHRFLPLLYNLYFQWQF